MSRPSRPPAVPAAAASSGASGDGSSAGLPGGRPPTARNRSQAQTRDAVMAAAERLFLDNGYQHTSLDDIAEAAGYSKGAVYSNFASKEDLFMAVSSARDQRVVGPLVAAVAAGGGLDAKLDAFERWIEAGSAADQRWLLVGTEFALVARKKPEIAARLRDEHRDSRASLADAIASEAAAVGVALALDPLVIADAVLALQRGLAIHHAVDHTVGRHVFLPVFRALLGVGADRPPVTGA